MTDLHVEKIAIQDRASWLELRKKDVTASVAGVLLGVHDYQSAYGLWALKSGRIEEDPEETSAMRRGRLLEDDALQVLAEDRPTWKVLPANDFYYRDPIARLGATPDAFAVDPEREGQGIIQVKTVEPSIFRKKWRDPETGAVELPLWIAVQSIVEAHLSGSSWAAVAAMTVGFGLDVHVIEVPIHAGVIERVKRAVADFWQMIDEGREPDPDYGRDASLIERLILRGGDSGEILDLSGDNMLPELLDERASLAGNKTAIEKRQKEIKAELLAKLGAAAAATIADGRVITSKTVHRKPYQVAASSYRDVRVRASI